MEELPEYKSDHDLLIELRTIVLLVKDQLDGITDNYVTQAEFWPVKTGFYGFVSLVLTAVVGALIFLVIKH